MEGDAMSDTLALKYATEALQSQEHLSWLVGQKDSHYDETMKDSCHQSLDLLRSQKSRLEGSHVDFESPQIQEESLVELKQQVLMYTPESLTDSAREKIRSLVENVLKDQVKDIVAISLLTCPWYEASQKERGEQAKHNILLVIFTFFDEQFLAPVNPQVKEKASIVDLGWLQAIELFHFGQFLAKGRSRFVEALYPRHGSLVWGSKAWQDLQHTLHFSTVTGTRGFFEACVGQAAGGISKKRKDGKLKMKEGSTVYEVCESLRLAHLAEITLLHSSSPCMEITEESLSDKGRQAIGLVKSLYSHPDPQNCKREIFELILAWVGDLRALYQSSGRPSSAKASATQADVLIGQWLMRTRLMGRELRPTPVVEDEHSHLVSLMQKIGGPLAKMSPEQIVLVAVSGSEMYNLSTPSSDVDYSVVFMNSTQTVLSATTRLQENFESKGLDKMQEYGIEEIRTFGENLLKCSVIALELVFAEGHEYTSAVWKELCKDREKFITEKAIQQYVGLIKNNFRFIEKGKKSDDPKRERKLFYKIFHKVHCINDMMHGKLPEVRLTGETREFIMNVRTRDDGEWSRDSVLAKATQSYREMRENLCRRKHRLKENTDYTLVTRWIMNARNLPVED